MHITYILHEYSTHINAYSMRAPWCSMLFHTYTMHITFIFHAYAIHIPGFGTWKRFPHYSLSPSLTESQLLTPSPRSIRVYFACSYLL